jgi:hypothetical protein
MNIQLQPRLSQLDTELLGIELLPPLLFGTRRKRPVGQPPPPPEPIHDGSTLGDPGRCTAGGSTVYLILDESLSVASEGGNDPLARRHEESAMAIRHVAAACRCRRDRVALVPFDVDPAGLVPPQPLTRAGLHRLRRGLHRLSAGHHQTSSLTPALNWTQQCAAGRDELSALVVFSDFLLTDPHPDQVLRQLAAFPGYVHAVVLGARPPSVLNEDDTVDVSVITPSSAPGDVARALFDGLTCYREGVSR